MLWPVVLQLLGASFSCLHSLSSHLDLYCLLYGKGSAIYLCIYLPVFIYEVALPLSARQ